MRVGIMSSDKLRKRLWGKANYATIMEHMPPDKLFFADWDRDRFLSWAEKTGSATRGVIEAILNRAIVEQQAYRSCFGVLNLQEKYGAERLERASEYTEVAEPPILLK